MADETMQSALAAHDDVSLIFAFFTLLITVLEGGDESVFFLSRQERRCRDSQRRKFREKHAGGLIPVSATLAPGKWVGCGC